ncbi:MAG: hypothetical protein ACRCTL_04610 [Pseudomonas sp.]
MSGVPDKRATYYLAGENCDAASCLLEGDNLYIWYEKNCSADSVLSYCFRTVDLNNFSGMEDVIYDDNNLSNSASSLIDCDGYICVSGGGNSVFRKSDLSLIYTETEDYLSVNGWSAETQSFFFDGYYYRLVNALSIPHKGYDVVDVESWDVARHIDMDMNHVRLIGNGLCYGVRGSKNFAVFSLINSSFVFELDTSNREDVEGAGGSVIHVADNGSFIAVLCGDTLTIIDPEERAVVNTIIISELNSLHAAVADAGVDTLGLCMSGVRFYESDVILSSGRCVICVVASSGVCRWVTLYPANVSISLACIHEDLVFGSKNSRPHAWDRYTGIEVWAASSALPCLSAQASKSWVVYHQVGGHINCYQWRKPYISPSRPS